MEKPSSMNLKERLKKLAEDGQLVRIHLVIARQHISYVGRFLNVHSDHVDFREEKQSYQPLNYEPADFTIMPFEEFTCWKIDVLNDPLQGAPVDDIVLDEGGKLEGGDDDDDEG